MPKPRLDEETVSQFEEDADAYPRFGREQTECSYAVCETKSHVVAAKSTGRSLFELCARASDATERQQTIGTYVGSGFRRFAAILSSQGLHRGVHIFTLVRNFGSIFREGTEVVVHGKKYDDPRRMERWYTASGPEMGPNDMLSGFVSHVWTTSGFRKGVALAMYFYNRRASSAMFMCLILFGAPLVFALKLVNAEQKAMLLALALAVIISYASYFLLLFFGDRMPCFLHGRTDERYFLDICCIPQNTDAKLNGVYHLAEYVMVSQRVIVCYTERYTTRLWCVFEMAVFFARLRLLTQSVTKVESTNLSNSKSWVRKAMHDRSAEFVFLPLFLPPISIAISLSLQACICLLLAVVVSDDFLVFGVLAGCCFILTLVLIAFGARSLNNAAFKMYNDFQQFSLDNAQCFSQDDRKMILRSINSFWGTGEIGEENAGLKEFEKFVQEDIAEFIRSKFVHPVGALRCLFANSGLVVVQLVILGAAVGAMVPFLMAAFMIDTFIGDAISKGESAPVPFRQRITCKRILIWLLMLIMSIFSAMHCFGYLVEPNVALMERFIETYGNPNTPNTEGVMSQFKQSVLVPNDYTIDPPLVKCLLSIVFGALSLLFLVSIFHAVFLRRHVALHAVHFEKPTTENFDSLSLHKLVEWARAWLRYLRSVTMPGAVFFWRRVFVMESIEFALQMVKLASYSGKDLYNGFCIYFKQAFLAITCEMVVDILYTMTPIVALGALTEPAAWYMLGDDDTNLIYVFTTLFPMMRSLSSLSQLDQINLNKSGRIARSMPPSMNANGSTESLQPTVMGLQPCPETIVDSQVAKDRDNGIDSRDDQKFAYVEPPSLSRFDRPESQWRIDFLPSLSPRSLNSAVGRCLLFGCKGDEQGLAPDEKPGLLADTHRNALQSLSVASSDLERNSNAVQRDNDTSNFIKPEVGDLWDKPSVRQSDLRSSLRTDRSEKPSIRQSDLRSSLRTDGSDKAGSRQSSSLRRVSSAVFDFVGIEDHGRQKGFRPLLELMLRFAIVAGLLTWVFLAMSHSCGEMDGIAGWRCDWITHPIFESPPCDCKIVSGLTYQPNDDGSMYCSLDGIFPLLHVATNVEYLFIQGHPILTDCTLDQERLNQLGHSWMEHMRGVQLNGALITSIEVPSALREAKSLRSLHIYVSQIPEIPDWFLNFQRLHQFHFVVGRLTTYPSILDRLPRLVQVNLDQNPICEDHNFRAQKNRYEDFSCEPLGHSVVDLSGNLMENDTSCFEDVGIWPMVTRTGLDKTCLVEAKTECTSSCALFYGLFIPLDTRPPKGAFDTEEINSQGFQNVLSAFIPGDNRVASSEQLQCSLSVHRCQNDTLGFNTTQLWYSTLSKFSNYVGGREVSDCSECGGSIFSPHYSLELQDPEDETKRKR